MKWMKVCGWSRKEREREREREKVEERIERERENEMMMERRGWKEASVLGLVTLELTSVFYGSSNAHSHL